jgi:Beta-lactamase class C and other penicillin binding proteins
MTAAERSCGSRRSRPPGSLATSIATTTVALLVVAPAPATASPADAAAPSGDPAYAAAVQPELDRLMRELAVTGAAVLVRSPELGDWATTMGTRTWHGTEPVTLADHVRVGSNTKTMTATVILQLVDEGRIGLDDPVSRYRPDVPNGENITIASCWT